MKKLLNTLYITRQESYLHKERETIMIKQGNEKLGQFPALTIGNIVCFGQISVSPFLMGYCAEQGIGLAFYTEYGKFLVRFCFKSMVFDYRHSWQKSAFVSQLLFWI